MTSKLMMRETELTKCKENNKQLMEQLSNIKQRESVSQVGNVLSFECKK